MKTLRRSMATVVLAAGLPCLPGPADAGMLEQILVAKKPGSGRDYDARTLAPEALRACLVDAWEYDTGAAAMAKEKARLEAERDALVALSEQLGANRDAILSPVENKRHNDRVTQLHARHKAFSVAVEAANAHAAATTSRGQAVQKACQGRNYLGADVKDLAGSLPPDLQKALEGK